jgi:membrane-bound metal-dependent hydrolase YbcI (DUF457 family)
MPRKSAHFAIGSASGIATGVLTCGSLPQEHRMIFVAFAGVGGALGGLAPDVLEPAVSPNHRSLFHSLSAAGSIGAAWLAEWPADCQHAAAECDARAQHASLGARDKSSEEIKAFLWRALAGLIVGFLAGYASHLVLDARTRKSLPLIASSF